MWRRRRDSNPRDDSSPTPLAGERLRPLGHVSVDAYTVTLCLFTRGFLKKLQLVCIALRWGHLWQIREIRYASVFYDDLSTWTIAYSKPKWQFWSCSGLSSELFYDTLYYLIVFTVQSVGAYGRCWTARLEHWQKEHARPDHFAEWGVKQWKNCSCPRIARQNREPLLASFNWPH